MSQAHHAIKAVARRTGLSAHVIRVWERRYGAVKPERTGANRRLYSADQIERLNLLREAIRAGHSIGQVAGLSTEHLRKLAAESAGPALPAARAAGVSVTAPDFLNDCIEAVKKLDAAKLEDALRRAAVALGSQGLLQRVIAPLAQGIGDMWREGAITAAHEHFASAVIRLFLGHSAAPFAGSDASPVVVVATPTGQLHELGALLAGASAANLGWRVTYLGASLPAAEIAGAARQHHALAVALSLVYPEDDSRLESELARLRELLPSETALLAGGRAAPSYRKSLNQIGALLIRDLPHLCDSLDNLRKPARKAKR